MPAGAAQTVLRHIRKWVSCSTDDACTDGQLLERFRTQADEGAFADLVRRHGRLVHNVCRRVLGDVYDAEDAFQATFFILARKANAIRDRDSVASWLYGVAYRVAVRARARAGCRATPHSEEIDVAQPDPANVAEWRELELLVDGELQRLPEKYKAPLLLCYFEGKSNDEAARLLHWPPGTVKGRLARAREVLRQRLARRGVTLTSGTVVSFLSGPAMAAPLPSAWVDSTVRATMQFVAGTASPVGSISTGAVVLTKGELESMFATKLRMMTAVMLLTGVSAWATWSACLVWADKPNLAAAAPVSARVALDDVAQRTTLEGRWTARLELDGKSITVRIELQPDGNDWKGTLRLSKDKTLELQKLRVSGAKVSFDCEADEAELSFKGELKDGTVTGSVEVLTKKNGVQEGTFTMTPR